MLWMKRSKDARVPASASVPIAVQTSVSKARCTASFKAREATDAENAVPFRIPRCSLDERGSGVMLCDSRAFCDEQISRAPNVAGPSKTRIDGLPVNVPAIYDNGERSKIEKHKRERQARIQSSGVPPEADILPRIGTIGVMLARRSWFIFSINSSLTPEWPRMREFIRISIAPRTQASGIQVE